MSFGVPQINLWQQKLENFYIIYNNLSYSLLQKEMEHEQDYTNLNVWNFKEMVQKKRICIKIYYPCGVLKESKSVRLSKQRKLLEFLRLIPLVKWWYQHYVTKYSTLYYLIFHIRKWWNQYIQSILIKLKSPLNYIVLHVSV